MRLASEKAREVYAGMAGILNARGYGLIGEEENAASFRKTGGATVVLLVFEEQVHDPVQALVTSLPYRENMAWNPKGLAVLLDRVEEVAPLPVSPPRELLEHGSPRPWPMVTGALDTLWGATARERLRLTLDAPEQEVEDEEDPRQEIDHIDTEIAMDDVRLLVTAVNEYEALLDTVDKARIVAEGGFLVIHTEWRDLEDSLARLDALRGGS